MMFLLVMDHDMVVFVVILLLAMLLRRRSKGRTRSLSWLWLSLYPLCFGPCSCLDDACGGEGGVCCDIA